MGGFLGMGEKKCRKGEKKACKPMGGGFTRFYKGALKPAMTVATAQYFLLRTKDRP
jgi:hypothetical protein